MIKFIFCECRLSCNILSVFGSTDWFTTEKTATRTKIDKKIYPIQSFKMWTKSTHAS